MYDFQHRSYITKIFRRLLQETKAKYVFLADRDGKSIVSMGNIKQRDLILVEPAKVKQTFDFMEEIGESQYRPPQEETMGWHYFRIIDRRAILCLVFPRLVVLERVYDDISRTERRLITVIDDAKKKRKESYKGYHLLTRFGGNMPIAVKNSLLDLCGLIVDLEEQLETGGQGAFQLVGHFVDTLEILLNVPKGDHPDFDENSLALLDTLSNIKPSDIDSDRIRAMSAGLEMLISSWKQLLPPAGFGA